MPTTEPDIVGDPLLKALFLELKNRSQARRDRMGHEIIEALDREHQKANEFERNNPRARMVIDVVHIRYPIYKSDASRIGEDYLEAFNSIVRPNSGIILGPLYSSLLVLFLRQYTNAMMSVREGTRRLLASLGRDKQFESSWASIEGIYGSAQVKYRDLLEAKIAKHNLELRVQGSGKIDHHVISDARKVRRRRTRAELESLTPRVVEAYEEFHDGGKPYDEIWKEMEEQSVKLFGEKLRAGQLEGIWNRRKKYL